jgi:hypothetical protein
MWRVWINICGSCHRSRSFTGGNGRSAITLSQLSKCAQQLTAQRPDYPRSLKLWDYPRSCTVAYPHKHHRLSRIPTHVTTYSHPTSHRGLTDDDFGTLVAEARNDHAASPDTGRNGLRQLPSNRWYHCFILRSCIVHRTVTMLRACSYAEGLRIRYCYSHTACEDSVC